MNTILAKDLQQRWQTQLEQLRGQGRYRRLTAGQGIDFSSNDYLGYGQRPLASAGEAPADLPRSGAASRLLRGHHALWDRLEAVLADWHGAAAALFFPSGYTANEGLLSTLIEPQDLLASDQFNHASIIDGARLTRAERFLFRHNDLNHLESGLRAAHERRNPDRQIFIVSESLFGMEGDVAPLKELAELARRFEAHLIVDEAHATGCFGPGGSGLVDALGLRDQVLATVHTGGKALGLCGAYVAGSSLLKDWLVNRCRHFIFTTALPPVIAQWWLDMLPIVQRDETARRQLHANAAWCHASLGEKGIKALGEYYLLPIVLGKDEVAVATARALQERGFDIRAIRPPTVPEGTARLRISIHADHATTTLGAVVETLATLLT